MPASTGVDLAARLCCYPGPHSAPAIGWAHGVRKVPKHADSRADRVRPLSLHKRQSRYLLYGPITDSHRRQLGVNWGITADVDVSISRLKVSMSRTKRWRMRGFSYSSAARLSCSVR